jgi:probable rRNA maturation factor
MKAGAPLPGPALTIQYAVAPTGLPSRAQLRRWAAAALRGDATATLRIVGEPEGRELNRAYRGRDQATNVLTFAYGAEEAGGPPAGDIVLCAPVVAREAAAQGKSLEAHYAHLVVHGMLHLQGYDHGEDAAATAMEAVETFVMMRMGYPDPYEHE